MGQERYGCWHQGLTLLLVAPPTILGVGLTALWMVVLFPCLVNAVALTTLICCGVALVVALVTMEIKFTRRLPLAGFYLTMVCLLIADGGVVLCVRAAWQQVKSFRETEATHRLVLSLAHRIDDYVKEHAVAPRSLDQLVEKWNDGPPSNGELQRIHYSVESNGLHWSLRFGTGHTAYTVGDYASRETATGLTIPPLVPPTNPPCTNAPVN